MHNKLLVLEFQSREPKSFANIDKLPYGVELELVCSNSTRKKVQKTKTSSQKYFFFTFQSVDNFDQTPGYEFENNDFYEKESFQHNRTLLLTQVSFRSR